MKNKLRSELIATITNNVADMFYKNEEYPLEDIRKSIQEGIITIDEMTDHFKAICETSMLLEPMP